MVSGATLGLGHQALGVGVRSHLVFGFWILLEKFDARFVNYRIGLKFG